MSFTFVDEPVGVSLFDIQRNRLGQWDATLMQVRLFSEHLTRVVLIATLWEQGRVHHVGPFPELEDQMCTWTPHGHGDIFPDRMDALVWGLSYLVNRRITKIWV